MPATAQSSDTVATTRAISMQNVQRKKVIITTNDGMTPCGPCYSRVSITTPPVKASQGIRIALSAAITLANEYWAADTGRLSTKSCDLSWRSFMMPTIGTVTAKATI